MRKTILLLYAVAGLTASAAAADSAAARAPGRVYSVGVGGGFESGIGISLGASGDVHQVQTTLGLLYRAQEAQFLYSAGLRYYRWLGRGQFNDTYAWGGGAVHGSNDPQSSSYLAALGLGLGLDFHLGLPFHFCIDSGWHIVRDHTGETSVGPTVNGTLTYNWRR